MYLQNVFQIHFEMHGGHCQNCPSRRLSHLERMTNHFPFAASDTLYAEGRLRKKDEGHRGELGQTFDTILGQMDEACKLVVYLCREILITRGRKSFKKTGY